MSSLGDTIPEEKETESRSDTSTLETDDTENMANTDVALGQQPNQPKTRNYSLIRHDGIDGLANDQSEPIVLDIVKLRRDSEIKRALVPRTKVNIELENSISGTDNVKQSLGTACKQIGRLSEWCNQLENNNNFGGDSENRDNSACVSFTNLRAAVSRRMSVEDPQWRNVGNFMDLSRFHCQRLYSEDGGSMDLALFYTNGKFYAMGAWCGHMGGPLYSGDIEDYNGRPHVMCPWHSYMFDLETGQNDLGLKQRIFPTKVDKGCVYVLYQTELSTQRYSNRSDSDSD